MDRIKLIETNLVLLQRTQLQGAEVEAYVNVTNDLQNQRNELVAAAEKEAAKQAAKSTTK